MSDFFIGQSLKYRKHRFVNYVILNFSKKCSFIKEIGVDTTIDNKLIIIVNGNSSKFNIFEEEKLRFTTSNPFKTELDFFYKNHVEVVFNYTSEYFTDSFISNLSLYYFYPEKNNNKYIFKYYSYDNYLLKVLEENELWFSNPKYFNDLFDCRYSIDAEPKENEVLDFYYKNEFKKSQISFDSFVQNFSFPTKERFLKDLETHHFEETISKFNICCFMGISVRPCHLFRSNGATLKSHTIIQKKLFQTLKVCLPH
ncbi:hypothetical protein [Myroides odoratimimus]|uniref:hypothetical protein n=1 Tax=Myroides odoratimimus TaxID=76832 RepID=UPI0009146F63|nr:hypothetical protein [Myroides odoratimimus]SHM20474.1 hypothetical protein SAMN05444275_11039 [Myroides odoratimimus subsp. xuanwuensis]